MNIIGILAAAVIYMVVGAIWYLPQVFGKEWMRLSGVSMEKMQSAGPMYLLAFVSALIMAFVLDTIVQVTASFTVVSGAIVGFWMWLGFVATTQFGVVLWEGRPWALFLLNTGCMLVTLLLMGGVIGWLS